MRIQAIERARKFGERVVDSLQKRIARREKKDVHSMGPSPYDMCAFALICKGEENRKNKKMERPQAPELWKNILTQPLNSYQGGDFDTKLSELFATGDLTEEDIDQVTDLLPKRFGDHMKDVVGVTIERSIKSKTDESEDVASKEVSSQGRTLRRHKKRILFTFLNWKQFDTAFQLAEHIPDSSIDGLKAELMNRKIVVTEEMARYFFSRLPTEKRRAYGDAYKELFHETTDIQKEPNQTSEPYVQLQRLVNENAGKKLGYLNFIGAITSRQHYTDEQRVSVARELLETLIEQHKMSGSFELTQQNPPIITYTSKSGTANIDLRTGQLHSPTRHHPDRQQPEK